MDKQNYELLTEYFITLYSTKTNERKITSITNMHLSNKYEKVLLYKHSKILLGGLH